MVMSRLASECSSACNKDALPDEPAKISPQRLSGFVRLGKYLNSIELGVGVDKLVPGGTTWFVELEDVRGFRRVAVSNVLVIGQSRKDAIIQYTLKGEGIFLLQVYACGIRRRCDAYRADGQKNPELSSHERTCALADRTPARHTGSRHARRTSSTTSQDSRAPATGKALWGRAASPRAPPALRIKNSISRLATARFEGQNGLAQCEGVSPRRPTVSARCASLR